MVAGNNHQKISDSNYIGTVYFFFFFALSG